MALGLAVLGHRVIKTVGVKLVKITPSRGFSIELGSAWTVLLFSNFGIPLSTTHCAVGSTMGVGLMEPHAEPPPPFIKGIISNCPPRFPCLNYEAVNWRLFGGVFVSWIGTIVFASAVAATVFSFSIYAPSIKAFPLSG